MAKIPGPAGEIQPGQRPPPGMQYAPTRWRGSGAPPDNWQALMSGTSAPAPPSPGSTEREVWDIERLLHENLMAWRPVVVSPGTLDTSEEYSLGAPLVPGTMLYRVVMRITSDNGGDTNHYWTFEVLWYDTDGQEHQIGTTLSTATRVLEGNRTVELWFDDGIRLEEDQEVVVRVVKNGMPADLEGLRFQGDWLVGV